jgi:hypothetical protein
VESSCIDKGPGDEGTAAGVDDGALNPLNAAEAELLAGAPAVAEGAPKDGIVPFGAGSTDPDAFGAGKPNTDGWAEVADVELGIVLGAVEIVLGLAEVSENPPEAVPLCSLGLDVLADVVEGANENGAPAGFPPKPVPKVGLVDPASVVGAAVRAGAVPKARAGLLLSVASLAANAGG